VLQCVAVCCREVLILLRYFRRCACCRVLQCIEGCCSVLQYAAECCSLSMGWRSFDIASMFQEACVLQSVAEYRKVLQYVAEKF